jgi:hypothetical protein
VCPEQSVHEMVEEVLQRQAKVVLERSRCSPQQAFEAVLQTDAGRQLSGLRGGPRAQEEKARDWHDWQEGLLRERTLERLEGVVASNATTVGRFRFGTERHYSWVEDYMEWMRGKEKRTEYHALLEEELASLRG